MDVSVSRAPAVPRPAAISARLGLAGIVGASFAIRFAAALVHTTPLYFPDEYIYASIARSLAASGKPLIRGHSAHFPSLLEPVLAAPFWLFHDPELSYRLTQAENALAMSLAAVPVYLLVRRLRGGTWPALAAAALTVASPDLFFSSFVTADAVAYPLVLGAVYLGVCALSEPRRRTQLGFSALAVLATFARIQYVFLPVVFLVAAFVVERGSLRALGRRFRVTILLYAAPLGIAAGLGPSRLLGYYSGLTSVGVKPLALGHWLGTDALLLAYAAGFALVPGALAGLAVALWRPRFREESAFAALTGGLLLAIFAEATVYASNGSDRFQERYLMVLLPLVFPAFWTWMRRGRPGARLVAIGSLALIGLAARVPLSGYTISDSKQDSPFLLAVFRLEKAVGIGTGSLIVAVGASVLALLALAVCFRPAFEKVAVLAAIAAAAAASFGAVAFDSHVVRGVRTTMLAPDARWVDHSGLKDVTLLETPATVHAATHEQLFWNESLKRVWFLDAASPIDAFGWPKAHAAADGSLVSGSKTLTGPVLVSEYGVRAQLADATLVDRAASFALWRSQGTPRFALFTGGLYHDGWLSSGGHITVYPAADGRVRGVLRIPVSLPPKPRSERTVLQLSGPGVQSRVIVLPGQSEELSFPVDHEGAWTLNFRTPRAGYLSDGRPVSVMAKPPTFTRTYAGSTRTSAQSGK